MGRLRLRDLKFLAQSQKPWEATVEPRSVESTSFLELQDPKRPEGGVRQLAEIGVTCAHRRVCLY